MAYSPFNKLYSNIYLNIPWGDTYRNSGWFSSVLNRQQLISLFFAIKGNRRETSWAFQKTIILYKIVVTFFLECHLLLRRATLLNTVFIYNQPLSFNFVRRFLMYNQI